MINITDKSKCYGCSACYNICPNGCISMQKDEEGFFYPHIDADNCTRCGQCFRVCQSLSDFHGNAVLKAYAGYLENEEIRLKSSSGGLVYALATYAFEHEGVVFGVRMNDKCDGAEYTCSENKKELEAIFGSKYMQADAEDVYSKCKDILEAGRVVIFTGTPCQINGLRLFLARDYKNLYCVDVVCHGLPSSKAWKEYIKHGRQTWAKNIKKIEFRNKKYGWHEYAVGIIRDNSERYMKFYRNSYMNFYLDNMNLRPSCYECEVKSERLSDITLGDMWGCEDLCPEFDDNKGTSLIIIRTKKGMSLFESINNVASKEISYDKAVENNARENLPPTRPKLRDSFYRDLDNYPYIRLCSEYLGYSKSTLIKKFIKQIFGFPI